MGRRLNDAQFRRKTDAELRAWFEYANDRFFGGEISLATKIEFAVGVFDRSEKEPGDGHYIPNKMLIQIDESLRGRNRQWQVITLHEMAHAYLFQTKGYVGYCYHKGHGMVFQGELCRLFQIGAYDGLL